MLEQYFFSTDTSLSKSLYDHKKTPSDANHILRNSSQIQHVANEKHAAIKTLRKHPLCLCHYCLRHSRVTPHNINFFGRYAHKGRSYRCG